MFSPQTSLPPPQGFDIVPSLHTLLSRLLPNPLDPASQPALSPKDLVTEIAAIKIRVQKARAAVGALPDIERSTDEQEEEIRELEEKIQSLKRTRRIIAEAGRGA